MLYLELFIRPEYNMSGYRSNEEVESEEIANKRIIELKSIGYEVWGAVLYEDKEKTKKIKELC